MTSDHPHAGTLRESPDQTRVASFDTYADAQRLVDRMPDGGFPVSHLRIIGDDLRTVEQVTGRLTKGRAALAGAASGAWFGLLIALIFSLFIAGPFWLWTWLSGIVIGGVWGAVFGYAAHWATRGQRDFSSVNALEARRYDVYVDASHADEARRFAA